MATNRERYINGLSNKELGILLSNKCYIGPDRRIKIERINEKIGMDSIEIYNWLSQEVEEDKDIKTTKDEFEEKTKTDANQDFIIKEIQKISDRLDKVEKNVKDLDFDDSEYCHMSHELIKRVEKLEKYSLVARDLILTESKTPNMKEDSIHDVIIDGYSYGTMETKTANQMFEELGYREIKSEDFDVEFIKYVVGTRMKIGIKLVYDGYIYEKSFEDPNCVHDSSEQITEAEDAAIHKKIKELKK